MTVKLNESFSHYEEDHHIWLSLSFLSLHSRLHLSALPLLLHPFSNCITYVTTLLLHG